jgi:hypothetical protein
MRKQLLPSRSPAPDSQSDWFAQQFGACHLQGVIDHLAFSATGLKAVKERFDAAGIAYDLRRQAGAGTWQLFSTDPNGAKVELDFDPLETL